VGALLGLRRRRHEGLGERLVLPHPVWERVAGEAARARLVVLPDRRRRHAGEVGAHHHLDRQGPALDGARHVRVRHVDQVVRGEAPRLLEPVRGELVQHLALERDRAQHHVEGTQPVRHHQDALTAPAVALAHLAVVVLAELPEVDVVQGLPELRPQDVLRNQGNLRRRA